MTEIIVSSISAIAAIVVAIISGINIKQRRQEDKLAQQRATEVRLGMDMQAACIELSDVIAIAVTGGHTNGNVEAARQKAQSAKNAYYNFINSIAADTLAHN